MERETEVQLIDFLSTYRSIETIKTYKSSIKGFLKYLQGKCQKIEEITAQDLLVYSQQFKPTTGNNKITAIKKYYKYLTNKEIDLHIKVRFPHRTDRNISINEVQQMMDNACSKREKIIIKTLFETGIRINELANLTKRSLLKKSDDKYYLKFIAKGNKAREIEISDDLGELLQKQDSGKETLFGLSTRHIERLIKELGQQALNRVITPHCFRHGFATELMKQGVSFWRIKEALGHESILTTLRYLHNKGDAQNWHISLNI